MLIQNRNAHVNTSVWPYRSDPNEFSFRFGVLVYTDWTGLHCPCKRIGIHESFCAPNCVSFLWPTPKILFPMDSLWLWLIEEPTEIYYYRCLQIKHISNPLCSRLQLSHAHARTHLRQTSAEPRGFSAYCRICIYHKWRTMHTSRIWRWSVRIIRKAVQRSESGIRMRV